MIKYIDESALPYYLDVSMGNRHEIAKKLVDVYINASSARLKQMLEGIVQKNYEEIRQQAHTLKSSSKMVGAKLVMQICLDIEAECKSESPRPDTITEKISELKTVLPPTIEELKQHPLCIL